MTLFPRFRALPLITLVAAFCVAGCHHNQAQTGPSSPAQDPSTDPAAANMAQVSTAESSAAPQSPAPDAGQSAAYPPADQTPSAANGQYAGSSDADYAYDNEQPADTAPDPPPPLPDYDQPPAPGDDYLWTPGYWDYGPAGYYWVPGVWVQAPYEGALWTPGWWGFRHNRYCFFPGYWGLHIGFYGGIDYGFGYTGLGYQGGYWHQGHFFYDRAVNNVNVNVVHNTYNYSVMNNRSVNRVSFNGGRGGIERRPRPAELAAQREPHAPAMSAQVQVRHNASTDRRQFASNNHGHPASTVLQRPAMADRNVHPAAARQMQNERTAHPGAAQPNRPVASRPGERTAPRMTPQRPAAPMAPRPSAPRRPETPERHAAPRPTPVQRAQPHPAPVHPAPRRPSAPRPSAPRPEPRRPAPHPAAPEREHPRP